MDRRTFVGAIGCLPVLTFGARLNAMDDEKAELTLVVMDPLAAPLACECVKGYAQRKYEVLGKYLEQEVGQKVNVFWAGALNSALEESKNRADIVIGKHSVVVADSKASSLAMIPVAELTGRDGKTTQSGLIVVRKDDPAKKLEDLMGYQILFGTEECDEKYAAPKKLFADNKLLISEKEECFGACSEAATALMEMDATAKGAAVISSYAKPLLEGCGTIQKGDLRVVAETEKVRFVTAFVNASLDKTLIEKITAALTNLKSEPALLLALETRDGFIPMRELPSQATDQPTSAKKN
jgi:ABC-type phosphate/phosphonate transport system substrate-binding protein